MKIALISQFLPKSPDEIVSSFIFDEACNLSTNDIKIYAILNRKIKQEKFYNIHYSGISDPLIKTIPFMIRNLNILPIEGCLLSPLKLLNFFRYGQSISKFVINKNIDIIHSHFAYPDGLAGLIAKRETGKPLILTLHGMDILTEYSIGYGYRLSKRVDAIIKKVIQNADAIITSSMHTYNEALKILPDNQKVRLIPNGVDLVKFNPDIEGEKIRERYSINDKFIVFCMKSHEPVYGIKYLIHAIPYVTSRNENIHFVFGGDGSLKKHHENLCKRLGVERNVLFTGLVPRRDVPYFYAASDVIVVPSLQEGFGLVVSEAMACGKVVIATAVGGILDQIIDGYNGLLVQPRNPAEIADKILWLIEYPKKGRRMGMNGRKIAEENFSINKRIEGIRSLYKMILGGYD